MEIVGGTKEDFKRQLEFYLAHPPTEALLDSADVVDLFQALEAKKRDEAAFSLVKEKLNLGPAEMLQLKDESQVSDEGIKLWIDRLPGLTCNFSQLVTLRKELKEQYQASLLPVKTEDGMAIHLPRLIELLKVAYPSMEGIQEILGVNMDATVMGGADLTSGSMRFLNDEFKKAVGQVNSRLHEWFFALYDGKDDKHNLEVNIFRNEEEG